jgi:AbrB family looped-hinge helix DNA binding protein
MTRRLFRVQQKGQVTLPAAIRRQLHLKQGDLVAIENTDQGVLITPQTTLSAAQLTQYRRSPADLLKEDMMMNEHESFAIPRPTSEVLARRKRAVARIIALRERLPSLAPLTAADLVRLGREEEGASYDPGD